MNELTALVRAPILEFDPNPEAMIEPAKVIRRRDVPEHCVVCWFGEVLEKVVAEKNARVLVENRWEDGPHPLYEMDVDGRRVAFYHAGIGSQASSLLEEVIAFGCRKFIGCGGCGVLEKDMEVGHLVVVTAAVRDEGASYHYLPPGREVAANPLALQALETLAAGARPAVPPGQDLDDRWTLPRDSTESGFPAL